MSYVLSYKNLGRRKASGTATVKALTYDELNRVFSRFFMSSLNFCINRKTGDGRIYFGWNSASFKFKKGAK